MDLIVVHDKARQEDELHRDEIRAHVEHWERIGGREDWAAWAERERSKKRKDAA
jgi:hypothetical protein